MDEEFDVVTLCVVDVVTLCNIVVLRVEFSVVEPWFELNTVEFMTEVNFVLACVVTTIVDFCTKTHSSLSTLNVVQHVKLAVWFLI